MKFFQSLYGKISAVFLLLLIVLGVVQLTGSLQSSMSFVRETNQALNRNLAHDLAEAFKPHLTDSLDYAGIEHLIHQLMVMNHNVEIYLLDDSGKILAFFAPPEKVKLKCVNLKPVTAFLTEDVSLPHLGDDPKNVGVQKPFSVTPIQIGPDLHGYLYVILGGEQYDTASEMVLESYIFRSTAISFSTAIILTAIAGLVAFALLTRRLRKMTEVVTRFEQGAYQQRIEQQSRDEVGQLANAFNQMADTIEANVRELKRTDQLRRELVANVSHDLRSPLASIRGYLETILIKGTKLKAAERKHYLQTILDNTVMLGKLVNELFELSKYDAQQIQPQPEPFSIAELAQDVIMKFQPRAEELKVELTADLPHDLPMVNADIGMIERAISNLIENALSYTPEEGQVRVELMQQDDRVQVKVQDTGCGIPEEELSRVFDRFYRVEKSRARASGGTGLGLAIVKRIIELHRSTISASSEVNHGTTFLFSLDSQAA